MRMNNKYLNGELESSYRHLGRVCSSVGVISIAFERHWVYRDERRVIKCKQNIPPTLSRPPNYGLYFANLKRMERCFFLKKTVYSFVIVAASAATWAIAATATAAAADVIVISTKLFANVINSSPFVNDVQRVCERAINRLCMGDRHQHCRRHRHHSYMMWTFCIVKLLANMRSSRHWTWPE